MKTAKNILRSFSLLKDITRASPGRIPLEILSVLTAVINSMLVRIVLVKLILDLVVQGRFGRAAIGVVSAACADLICSAFDAWMNNCFRPQDNIRLHRYFHEKLYRCAVDVDIRYYDNPDYYDQFILAARNSDAIAVQYIATLQNFLVTIAEIFISGGLIISKLGSLLWIVLISSTLYMIFTEKNAQLRVTMTEAQNPYEKKREYIKRTFFIKKYALDMRATNISGLLYHTFASCQQEALKAIRPFAKKRTMFYAINGFLFYFQYVAVIVFLTWKALTTHEISVGDFSMLLESSLALCNNWRFIGNTVGSLSEQGMFSDRYYRFVRIAQSAREDRPCVEAPRHFFDVKVENVSFCYDKETKRVFTDLSMKIQKGQKIALVGPNGAGKSTFVSLLLNLYQPQEGMIRYNGRDIRQYEPFAYRDTYSLIFQDSQLYPFTIAENLLFRMPESTEDEQRMWNALKQVGLYDKIQKMPLGLFTTVTKEFDNDGVVFSGGECQRLALARAILQDTSFFIMDEPTSALDPKQELQLNNLFTNRLHDNTLILISHRLSTISGTDYIYLLDNGKIEEEGTHDELMKKNGHYARIYQMQSNLYAME